MSNTKTSTVKREIKEIKKLAPLPRLLVEMGFIIFLFYSNLLMGELDRMHIAQGTNFFQAIAGIFTVANFIVAVVCSLIGYVAFEYLRTKI